MGAEHHACTHLYTVSRSLTLYGVYCTLKLHGSRDRDLPKRASHADKHAHSFPALTLQVLCARSSASRCSPALAGCTLM